MTTDIVIVAAARTAVGKFGGTLAKTPAAELGAVVIQELLKRSKLNGEQISLFAKMGAVCDVYDAITSNRPYKIGWEPSESIRKMAEWSKGHFDERVFQAFVKSIGIYPVGSLVRLESGRLGVVTEQNPNSLLSPQVKVFFSTKAQTYIKPELLDLAHRSCNDKIVSHEDPAQWGLQNINMFLHGN